MKYGSQTTESQGVIGGDKAKRHLAFSVTNVIWYKIEDEELLLRVRIPAQNYVFDPTCALRTPGKVSFLKSTFHER